MEVLGLAGNLYIVILLAILVLGVGVIGYNFSKGIWKGTEKLIEKKGGTKMNKWFKLAATSFAGIVIATFALGLTSTVGSATDSSSGHDHAAHTSGMSQTDSSNMGSMQTVNYGTANSGYSGNYDAQLYQIQYNMMQLQQQLQQLQAQLYSQQMNGAGMNGGNMNNMNSGSQSGGSSSGGMGMM